MFDDDDEEEEMSKVKVFKKDRKWKYLWRKIELFSFDEGFFGDDIWVLKDVGNELDLDEWEREEEERWKDLEERDVFVDRLKKCDKEKIRNIMERLDKKVF